MTIRTAWRIAPIAWLWIAAGCAPSARLWFPNAPLAEDAAHRQYDVDRNNAADFTLLMDDAGRLTALAYDDDQDGSADRHIPFQSATHEGSSVAPRPHLVLMLDSIPFEAVREQFEAGRWPWFQRPVKVIPPFPTMSGLIFTDLTHAPALPGMINRYYDRRSGRTINRIVSRSLGDVNPWHRRLHYKAAYWENGLAFLQPRSWFAAELARIEQTFDTCSDRVCIVYLASTSGMLSRFGRSGLVEALDGMTQLCLQLLYERQGQLDITVLADHGHNLTPGHRIEIESTLRAAGYRPASRLRRSRGVVIENDGMVNYIGLHTDDPAGVAEALVSRPEVQLAMYRQDDTVVVRDACGAAVITGRDNSFQYQPMDRDVLGYAAVIDQLKACGVFSADGFAGREEWFNATVDHQYPDGPPRIWRAFDGLAVNTPDVMLTLRDGYCTGLGFLELFISMQSTHGGLDQVHSATFVISTTDRARRPMRSDQVLEAIEPGLLDQLERLATEVEKQ